MFDSLYLRCTCGKEVEFQSKSGPCVCASFDLNNCPQQVAIDLIGKTEMCECGQPVTLQGRVMLFVT
jgi:hypothetical protein